MNFVKGWSNDDRHLAAQFFSTPTAQRLLETLRINRPKLGGATTEAAAASSNKAAGYEQCFDLIADILGTDMTKVAASDKLEQLNPNAFSSREVKGAQQQ